MKTVLIVDDSAYNRSYLTALLRKKGVKVEIAEDGEIAVKKFIEVKPDLVFLDYIMPKKSGIEALREMKALNSEFVGIMLTSVSASEEVLAAKQAGANGYVLKPYKPDKIYDVLKKYNIAE
jgi:two-component system, chemotaxis family, chemotaxis protein CheY